MTQESNLNPQGQKENQKVKIKVNITNPTGKGLKALLYENGPLSIFWDLITVVRSLTPWKKNNPGEQVPLLCLLIALPQEVNSSWIVTVSLVH